MADADTVTVHRNRPFRDTPSRTLELDIWESGDADSDGRPAVLLLHGGAWREGTKGQFARYALDLASDGYVTVEPTYRLAGEETFPAQVTDVVAAVRWLRANAGSWGVDPDRIALAGHSAGAHLAVLAALTPGRWVDVETTDPPGVQTVGASVAAVVGVSGVYEFRDQGDPEDFVAFLGGTEAECPDRYRAAAPVAHVRPDAPPTLLLHGDDDDVVPPRSSELLASALDDAGASVEYESYPGADHVFLHSSAHYADTLSRVREFLGAHL